MAYSIYILAVVVLAAVYGNVETKVISGRMEVEEGKFVKGLTEQKRTNYAKYMHKRALRAASGAVMADYEARVAEYVKEQEAKYGPVEWYDMYGENPVIHDNPDYSQYKIDVTAENVVFADPTEDITGPGFTYTQWYHNGGTTEIKSVFEKTTDVENSYEWSLEAGVNVKTDEKISVHVPIVFDWGNNYTAELAMNVDATESYSETETYSIQNTILIPPKRSVEATFTIEENHMLVPWTADIVIGGYIAIWYVDQVDGHWLWFHPTYATANEQFVQDGDAVRAQASGSFFGTKGVDHYLIVKDYPLWPNVTTEPIKVTEYDHHPQKPFMIIHGV